MRKSIFIMVPVALVVITGIYLTSKEPSVQPVESRQQENSLVSSEVAPLPAMSAPKHDKIEKESLDDVSPANLDDEPEAESYALDVYAIESMKQARQIGDPRVPALSTSLERALPTAEELADYDAYANYEQRQSQAVYREFIKAASLKAEFLRDMIAKAKQDGLSEEQIAEGEEKLRRIENMREELLQQNPELALEQERHGANIDSNIE